MQILDIGSGDRPLEKATVLCDLYLKDDFQRAKFGPLVIPKGKDFVCCDAHSLPFKGGYFDYVNCTHVLEHANDPSLLFREVKRVARHGYIETPSWFAENIFYGWPFHKWIITVRKGALCYRKTKRLAIGLRYVIPLGFIFHNLYEKLFLWRKIHRALDKFFNMLYTRYRF